MTPRLVAPTAVEATLDPEQLRVWGPFGTAGREIVEEASGDVVRLIGVNWHGAEGFAHVPSGLWTRNYRDMLDQIADTGFNVLRIPVSPDVLTAGPSEAVDGTLNPTLADASALEVLDAIVAYAGQIGLRVILDMHRRDAGIGKQEDGLWVGDGYSEADLIDDWQALAGRYAGDATVIGADLFNEPSGEARWSNLDPRTPPENPDLAWSDAAGRIGDAVLEANPDLLILVEGVHIVDTKYYWVGGNLRGVRFDPVEISDPGKLVYAPHDYPWGVRYVPWLDGATAEDMIDNWRTNWSYLYEESIAPVLITEVGSRMRIAEDELYVATLMDYLQDTADGDGGMNLTWWTWGPNSGDTGGILKPDWQSLEREKLDALAPLLQDRLPGSERAAREVHDVAVTISLDADGSVPWNRPYRYETLDLTATAGEDYYAEEGVIQVGRNRDTATTTLRLISDDVAEAREDFLVRISTVDGAPLGVERVTIRDDDGGPEAPADAGLFLESVERSPGVWSVLVAPTDPADASEGLNRSRTVLHSDLFTLSDPTKGSMTADGPLHTIEMPSNGRYWNNRVTAELAVPLEEMIGLEQTMLFARPFEEIDPNTPPELLTDDGLLYSGNTSVRVSMEVDRVFGAEFTARVTLTNTSDDDFDDWQLRLTGPFDVTDASKVSVIEQDEDWIMVDAPSWNADLEAGESFTFAIRADADLDPAAHIVGLDVDFF